MTFFSVRYPYTFLYIVLPDTLGCHKIFGIPSFCIPVCNILGNFVPRTNYRKDVQYPPNVPPRKCFIPLRYEPSWKNEEASQCKWACCTIYESCRKMPSTCKKLCCLINLIQLHKYHELVTNDLESESTDAAALRTARTQKRKNWKCTRMCTNTSLKDAIHRAHQKLTRAFFEGFWRIPKLDVNGILH